MSLIAELDAMIYNQYGMFKKETCDYFWDHYRITDGLPKSRFQMLQNQLWNLKHLYA